MSNVKLALLVLSAVSAFAPNAIAGGFTVGKGGDAVICTRSADSPFDGTYALDYLATYDPVGTPLQEAATVEESLARLHRLFAAKVPEFLETFDDFVASIGNTTDLSKKRVWEAAPFGLVDIEDEQLKNLLENLPNCLDDGHARVVQAVIRQWPTFSGRPPQHVVYKFVPSIVNELRANAALQLSLLYVHEWLWDLSLNVERNRRVNRFLHSTALDTMTRPEILAQLNGMGLTVPGMSPPVFRADACTADSNTGTAWNERLSEAGGRIISRQYEVYARSRSCETARDCPASWVERSDEHRQGLGIGQQRLVDFVRPGHFVLASQVNGTYFTHASCDYDAAGAVRCSVLKDKTGGSYQYQRRITFGSDTTVDLTGTLGEDCLRLVDTFWYAGEMIGPGGQASTFREEGEFVLYGKLPPP